MTTRSPSTVADDLRRLGVRPGDVVMVHASLRRLGPVEGGAVGVIEAIDAAVGPDGSWMMILGARDDHDWVNEQTADDAERIALLADAEPFDHLLTPAQPDVGVLAEVVRTHPGTMVNDHPEARFSVRGPHARVLLDDAPVDDYYGPGSPLARLVGLGGRVLRVGADPETTTLLHHAEYLAAVPDKRRVRRHRKVRRPDGSIDVIVVSCLDDEHGIVDHDGPDEFGVILADYLATGRAATGRVGDADAVLADAGDLLEFGTAWLTREFGAKIEP